MTESIKDHKVKITVASGIAVSIFIWSISGMYSNTINRITNIENHLILDGNEHSLIIDRVIHLEEECEEQKLQAVEIRTKLANIEVMVADVLTRLDK